MIFSYGFLDESQESARELFLDLDIPNDDPLKMAKKFVNKDAPGFKIYLKEGSIKWEGSFVWWVCVNEEDGLDFQVLRSTDGNKDLIALWQNQPLNPAALTDTLKKEANWDVFQLRAIVTLQTRVVEQLQLLDETAEISLSSLNSQQVDKNIWKTIRRLRTLEEDLLHQASQSFEEIVGNPFHRLLRVNADPSQETAVNKVSGRTRIPSRWAN